MDLVEQIKIRLGIAQDENKYNDLIQSYLNQVENKITDYCNIFELPAKLSYTAINMTIDLIRFEAAALMQDVPGVSAKEISSIQRGDTTIKYGQSGSEVSNKSKSILDDLVLNYKYELNRYRRVKAV